MTKTKTTPLSGLATAGMEPLTSVGRAFIEGWVEASGEIAAFLGRRIQSDIDLQRQILQCRDPAELVRIQTAFVEKAVEDYRAETGKLARIGHAMREAVLPADTD